MSSFCSARRISAASATGRLTVVEPLILRVASDESSANAIGPREQRKNRIRRMGRDICSETHTSMSRRPARSFRDSVRQFVEAKYAAAKVQHRSFAFEPPAKRFGNKVLPALAKRANVHDSCVLEHAQMF